MPYKRIAVYEDVAKLERRTSKMLQVSYIDELQDKYEAHFEFLKAHVVPQIQGTRSLIQILNTLKYSAYLDEDLVSLTVGAYKNNLASPITDRVGLLGLSHVLSCVNHFGLKTVYDKMELTNDFEIGLSLHLNDIDKLSSHERIQIKGILLTYLRAQAMFTNLPYNNSPNQSDKSNELDLVKHLFSNTLKDSLTPSDYRQLYQYLLTVKANQGPEHFNEEPLLQQLRDIWFNLASPTEEYQISKLHQDVYSTLQRLPKSKLHLNHITPSGLEVDILLTKYKGTSLKSPIALEVNGVYHYPRNSEIPLGKDRIKQTILTSIDGI